MLENPDIAVGVIVLMASAVLFLLIPNWETVQFIFTMLILFAACFWVKEIIEKDGNKKI
tara:strand:- start:11678 stop:11854 length:177 start_codon:yes stop_codon:yes gene_type:complete